MKAIKLNKNDKEILKNIGYSIADISRIQYAIEKTKYTINDKCIFVEKVIEILGRQEFLSGISRSVFHWTAVRGDIMFDSSMIF